MKKAFIVLFFLIGSLHLLFGQPVKVMTYNIRYNNPDDGENRWDVRKGMITDLIKFYEPDIFGIQEGLAGQMNYLDSTLTNYQHIGIGRDGGKKGEYSAIFYNKKKFKLIRQSTFWLSDTPDTISIGWDAALKRICTYGLFEEKGSKQKFWVFNTHLDYLGIQARINSAKLIIERIKKLNKDNLPVILTGDFNSDPESEQIKYLSDILNDSKPNADFTYGNNGTFNNFEFNKSLNERIDYIFTSKTGVKVMKYAVLSDSKNCHYPSDHLPVYAELLISGK